MSASLTATSSVPRSTSTKFDCDGCQAMPAASSSAVNTSRAATTSARRRSTKAGSDTPAMPAASAARLTLNGSCTRSSRRATSGSEIAKPTRRPASPRIFENERMTITGLPSRTSRRRSTRTAGSTKSMYVSSATTMQSAGSRARKASHAAGSMHVPVGLLGSQIQTRRACVATAASATAARSISSPAGGTRVTTPPAAWQTAA